MEQKSTVGLPCLFLRMKLLNYTQGTLLSASQTTCAGSGCWSTPLITCTQEAGLSLKSREHFVLLILGRAMFLLLLGTFCFGLHLHMGVGHPFVGGSEDNLRGSDNFYLVDHGY